MLLSDGEFFVSAAIAQAAAQLLQRVQNNCLLQLLTWYLVKRSGHTVLVIMALKNVGTRPGVIGQPKPVQPTLEVGNNH